MFAFPASDSGPFQALRLSQMCANMQEELPELHSLVQIDAACECFVTRADEDNMNRTCTGSCSGDEGLCEILLYIFPDPSSSTPLRPIPRLPQTLPRNNTFVDATAVSCHGVWCEPAHVSEVLQASGSCVVACPHSYSQSVNRCSDQVDAHVTRLGEQLCTKCTLSVLQRPMRPETGLGSSLSAHQPRPPATLRDVGSADIELQDLLSAIESSLCSSCRTLLLLYFLAVLHAFTRAIPLKKKAYKCNRAIGTARSCLVGAPIRLACFWVLHLPQPALGMEEHMRPGPSPVRVEVQPAPAHPSEDARNYVDSDIRSRHSFPHFFAEPDPAVYVGVYRLQTSPHFERYELFEGDDVGCLLHQAAEDWQCQANPVLLYPFEPQPALGHVAIIATPRAARLGNHVPVFVQIIGQHPREFVSYLPGECGLHHIALTVGTLWPREGSVYHSTSPSPVHSTEVCNLSPGDLLTVLCPGFTLPGGVALRQVLSTAVSRCSAADVEPVEEFESFPCVGMVGPYGDWGVLPEETHGARACIQSICAGRYQLPTYELEVHSACCTPRDLWFRGFKISGVVGVSRAREQSKCTVFLDARKLACPVQMLELDSVRISIVELLLLAGAGDFSEEPLNVQGAPLFDVSSGTFMPAHAALITVESADPLSASRIPRPNKALPMICTNDSQSDSGRVGEPQEPDEPDALPQTQTASSDTWNRTPVIGHAIADCRSGDTPVDDGVGVTVACHAKERNFRMVLAQEAERPGCALYKEVAEIPGRTFNDLQGCLEDPESSEPLRDDLTTPEADPTTSVLQRILVKVLTHCL